MKSLRTFTCSRSSRSNELIKVSQQSLTNQVITFDLIGKQWPLDTLIEWNARVENSKSFRSTLKPQEGLSLNDCQHATCLDNSSECSSDIKMLLTSVLWRQGVTLLKNWTFCEWFSLFLGKRGRDAPFFSAVSKRHYHTHIILVFQRNSSSGSRWRRGDGFTPWMPKSKTNWGKILKSGSEISSPF